MRPASYHFISDANHIDWVRGLSEGAARMGRMVQCCFYEITHVAEEEDGRGVGGRLVCIVREDV